MDSTITLSRKQLFDLVWEKPLSRLAEELQVSDVGIAKMCKRLNIPRPAQGHWVRVRLGREVQRPRLPQHEGPNAVELPRVRRRLVVDRDGRDVPAVKVPSRLHNPHPIVERLRAELNAARVDHNGRLAPGRRGGLVVEVGEQSKSRALLIANTFLRSLEERSIVVVEGQGFKSRAALSNGEAQVTVSIREKLRRVNHELTDEERAREARSGWSWHRKYDFHPTGELRIQLDDVEFLKVRKSWSDGKRAKIEEKLGAAVLGVEFALAAIAEQEREWAAARKRRDEEHRLRQEAKRQREDQARKVAQLEALARQWEASGRIRRFIEAVRVVHSRDVAVDPFKEWLAWANSTADSIDPTRKPIESLLESTCGTTLPSAKTMWDPHSR